MARSWHRQPASREFSGLPLSGSWSADEFRFWGTIFLSVDPIGIIELAEKFKGNLWGSMSYGQNLAE
jgi:hypothetical protein